MTYDISLVKNGKDIPTPLTIHGMAYGVTFLPFAKDFIFSDKELSAEEAKVEFAKFHDRFVKHCQQASGHKTYFGSDAGGVYYMAHPRHNKEHFATSIRLLQVYAVAVALNAGIRFR